MVHTQPVAGAAPTVSSSAADAAAPTRGHPPRFSTAADLEAFADSFFTPYLREFPAPSLAVAVVYRDSVVLLKGYGHERTHPERPVDADSTLFNVASISKLFTAAAAMQLVEQGRLAPDEDVSQWLGPGWVRGEGPPITLRHLLTHTSGLDGAFMRDVVARPSELVPLRDYLARFPPRRGRPPGREIRYSNLGMALVGRIVEVGSGLPFDDYAVRHLFVHREPPAR